jgi:hypothetical protein
VARRCGIREVARRDRARARRAGVEADQEQEGDQAVRVRSPREPEASAGARGAASRAQALLEIDEQIGNHRFLELRHQLTHSLAPILAWQSLLWFEVAQIDQKGGVVAYSSRHLTPSERIQGETPPDELYARTIADGREVIDLMRRAMLALAELLTVAGKLEPPPVLWRVTQTGEVFFDRAEASRAARAASGYVSPFELS